MEDDDDDSEDDFVSLKRSKQKQSQSSLRKDARKGQKPKTVRQATPQLEGGVTVFLIIFQASELAK